MILNFVLNLIIFWLRNYEVHIKYLINVNYDFLLFSTEYFNIWIEVFQGGLAENISLLELGSEAGGCVLSLMALPSKGVTYLSEPQFLSLKVRRVNDFLRCIFNTEIYHLFKIYHYDYKLSLFCGRGS